MVIAVVLSGIMSGFIAVLAAVFAGFPLWSVLLMYPVVGTLGALAMIGYAATRQMPNADYAGGEFAA